jgi:aromatic-L-amino-acid decarboxylase
MSAPDRTAVVAPDRLTLPAEEVRRLGYRVIDAYVDHLTGIREIAPSASAGFDAFQPLVNEPAPEGPADPDAVLDLAVSALSTYMNHSDHPRNFARVPSPSNAMGVLGDMLATAMNAAAMSASGHPGPTALELVVLEWLTAELGLPPETDGVLLSGGSVSSLTAFATARHVMFGEHDASAVVYLSDQTHSSMARGLRVLGFTDDRIRTLPTDDAFRLPIGALTAAVEADRAAGLRPFMVVATAGTTNTGAVDPLLEIADVAAANDLWFHVDGAFGAPAAFTPGGREILAGIERADSVTLDPHKWLFSPYETGVLLVSRPGALDATFAVAPEYLRDTAGDVNFRDRGPQLTRGTRAVKLWMMLKTFGLGATRDAIARGIELAEVAEAALRATPGWEIVTPAQLAVVTFAHESMEAGEIVARATAEGYSAPSSTVLRGRSVVRLCTINPRTSDAEMVESIARLSALAGG